MSSVDQRSFDTAFAQLAEAYLEAVESCLAHLEPLVETYDYEPARFEQQVTAIHDCESACDDRLRELRVLIGESMPANFTGVYLLPGEILALFSHIDAVANATETVAANLGTMRPPISDSVRTDLLEIVDYAESATDRLTSATAAFADHLCGPGVEFDPTDDIETIRMLEGEADDVKRRVTTEAFADGPTVDALAVRAIVLALDDVPDAVEDAADHLGYVQSAGL